ncbi:MAG TPA: trypsin-like peptidase domain-containing protein, partial [Burkholderiales bacterium]|nr:trypsin-like peptidase domain-containing protein [Burkholderiales bacterium]
LALLLLLAAAPAAAQAPDFTAVVRDGAAAVVNMSGGARAVLPDLPLADEAADDPALMRDFLRREYGPEMRSLGSGFLIDAAGYIITNAHIVAGRAEIAVRLADRREFEARVIGLDPLSDIALIKIEAAGLPQVRIGDPARLRPGEWVVAIGSPFGLERSVTAGIVSALGRTLPEETFVPFIQTDVAVNPGNSGGPLFNVRGEVVGVNSGFYSETGGYSGLSFAIPIDMAMEVAAQLRTHGKVSRGRIGVRLQEMTAELARALKLTARGGALVAETFRGGAAMRAGIRPGDVIVRFDGKPVESEAALVRHTAGATPGATVEIELVRFGSPVLARVRIDPARVAALPPAAKPQDEPLGVQLVPLERQQRERLRIEGALRVERARGAAQRAGLERGDLILSVNGTTVSKPELFFALLQAAGKGATVALLVQRHGLREFVPLRAPR